MNISPQETNKQFSSDVKVRVKEIKRLHEDVCSRIEKQNTMYVNEANRQRKLVEFHVDDLVWIHLRNDRFP